MERDSGGDATLTPGSNPHQAGTKATLMRWARSHAHAPARGVGPDRGRRCPPRPPCPPPVGAPKKHVALFVYRPRGPAPPGREGRRPPGNRPASGMGKALSTCVGERRILVSQTITDQCARAFSVSNTAPKPDLTHLAAHTAPPTAPLPQPNRPALSRRLVFRQRFISLDEQRSGAAHRLDNDETLRYPPGAAPKEHTRRPLG